MAPQGHSATQIPQQLSLGEVDLWPNLTGQEILDALAGLRGTRDLAAERRLVAEFALDTHRLVRTYSKGDRQKVILVAAFAAPTELLVPDEPTSGLDPLMEEVFQSCVRKAAAAGRTALLSSHILAEAEQLCESVTIIKDGKLRNEPAAGTRDQRRRGVVPPLRLALPSRSALPSPNSAIAPHQLRLLLGGQARPATSRFCPAGCLAVCWARPRCQSRTPHRLPFRPQ